MDVQVNDQPDLQDQPLYVDRPFTYKVTVASLMVGVFLAGTSAWLLLSLLQLPTEQPTAGETVWSPTRFALPATFIVSGGILFWAIFGLPVRIAKRRGVILDPEVYPWTGAVLIGVIATIAFVVAILSGRI
ncbi:hypothetical protein ANRL4_00463 [Anaerolineae bacterium]|nr:hypothetical protein ANRL4_00463 [Anaerolineae bacterium]